MLFIVIGALTACGGVTPGDRLYRAFTRSEEAVLTEAVGEKIPFLPNDDYYFEVTEDGILFSTVGNTEEELSAYLLLFSEGGYSVSDRYDDDKGIKHNVFTKGNVNVDICSFTEGEDFIVKLLIYPTEKGQPDDDNDGDNTGGDNTGGDNAGDTTGGDNTAGGGNTGDDNATENDTVGELATSIKNGDKVVIAAPAYNKILSMTKITDTYYNMGVDYTGTDFAVATDNEIFTVTVNADSSYTFTSLSGKVLALGADYNSLSDTGANNKWTLEAVSGKSGVYYLKNEGRGNYLEWYADKGNWSTYTSAADDRFEISFFVLGGTSSDGGSGDNNGSGDSTGGDNTGDNGGSGGTTNAPFENGDTVVIAAPAYNKLLSMTKITDSYYNLGVDYTGSSFSVATSNEVFTVTVNSDGSYTFTSLSGKVLAMADSYASLSETGANDKWTLEAVSGKSGVYYVKNVGRGNYLEWYAEKDNWSTYSEIKDSALFEIAFYTVDASDIGDGGADDNTGSGSGTTSYTYTDFTSAEKSLFLQYIGEVIPFVPNDEYYVEGWDDSEGFGYEYGMCFYTFGNTADDFAAYRLLFSEYELYETYEDSYGDTWYCYIKGDIVVDVSFYTNEGVTVIDLYVYSETLSLNPDEDTSSGSGDNNGSDTGSGSGSSDVTLFENEDAGLPEDDGDGVYDVDFTEADKVDDVTDQGYYLGGCPTTSTTTGKPGVLVIPIQFSDVTAASRGFTIEAIKNAFLEGGVCDYYSVYDYYYLSSMGQLELNITVVEQWFTPIKNSEYYKSCTDDSGNANGDQIIMDEALAWLDGLDYDLSVYDSDGNDMIDAVVLINTLEIGEDDFNWAYRYWNYYTDDEGYYYEYDGVSANDYLWASYQFLFESESGFDDEDAMNTYTFIHEFGHILGADDYYDTSYSGEKPLGGYDIMDSMAGDHNAYTKINLGWITTSRLITTDSSVTLTLESFGENGDTIIIANDWDSTLGAYQEYYIIVYYKNDGLNAGDAGYFDTEGILVYHVNATLYSEVYEGTTYYDVYYNNTDPSDEYGTEHNLIEYVASADGDNVYEVGEQLSADITDDSGEALGYIFVVNSLDGDTASITVTKV